MSYEKKNTQVLIEDTDAFGRLNWRVFCRYCELGEAGLLNTLGFNQMYFYEKYKISFPRRFSSFEYLSQVFPTDLAKAEVVIVAYDEKNHRKTPLPKELVDKIREMHPEAFET